MEDGERFNPVERLRAEPELFLTRLLKVTMPRLAAGHGVNTSFAVRYMMTTLRQQASILKLGCGDVSWSMKGTVEIFSDW